MGSLLFSTKIKKILKTVPAILYMSFIFFLSSKSQIPFYIDVKNIDKLIHFLEYFILGILLSIIEAPRIILILFGTAYGAFDELHQSFVPGREASFFDFLFDFFGILFAFFLVSIWKKRKY